jgi:two-component system response regulator VanR
MIRQNSNVPIIFLSALNQEENQVKGFELECDDYITKPFSFNLLIKRVEAVLRRSLNLTNNESLSFEDLKLNLNTYTVEVEGETLIIDDETVENEILTTSLPIVNEETLIYNT